ncbi:MAG: 30S ribosomal protein S16 [Candidatus Tagabacteria bacterium CG09_land_8_20_14_0_10_41_14]|uniref:Small ribosomal subunit protein bS16 n=2 Tax=Candidatus Tagaibacteriota TaxID=1817918 RepID=A0A2H0WKJ0_9BACT|nr:MAG: 30S ribosomal protein S16 [Candidatus Tagabacteria bacterium CG09_land_8_20_14_0_10_41_14]PJE73073.1 MAG: 30S ribosomal protein S16 [Candidatus Tagabacteria bacterium CG10_big_fil_rev_8_21_14_0_10_40_13]
MLRIRLNRVGRKHDPSYRLVVTDSRKAPQAGAYLENLGFCDFRKDKFQLKEERIKYWIFQGAQLSDTVHNVLVSEKIIEGKKKDVSSKRKRKKKAVEEKKEASEKAAVLETKTKAEKTSEINEEPIA